MEINGSGIVKTNTRGEILHTWGYPDFYKLSKNHLLENIPQDLYEMNAEVIMKQRLPLQKSRINPEIVVTLEVGEEVTILSSDNKEWCLVENSKGVRGWFAVNEYCEIRGTGKDAHEIFEGLCYAD